MKKKEEMIKGLLDEGFDIPDLKWQPFQSYYKEKMEEVEDRKNILSKPDEESVNEDIEREIEKQPDLRTPLEKKRDELFPQIVDVMKRLKGRSNATHAELGEMFSYYNAYFLRSDSPSCGACTARVYRTFQKMTKGWI